MGERAKARVMTSYAATSGCYDELYAEEQFGKYAVAFRAVKPSGAVLDAGCGTGLLLEYMKATWHVSSVSLYLGLDLTYEMVRRARLRAFKLGLAWLADFIVGDVERLPLREAAFDVVYAFTVMDLLENGERGLHELKRVCRGRLVYTRLLRSGAGGEKALMEPGSTVIGLAARELVASITCRHGVV